MSQEHLLVEPEVDFDCNDPDIFIYDWLTFWDSTRSWLAERGYTLFEFSYHWEKRYGGNPQCWVPKLSNPLDSDVKHPFAKYGGDSVDIPTPPLSGGLIHRIAFAQDPLNRHVALRLIKKGGHEYEIAQFLSKQASLSSLEGFEGVLAPLDLLDMTDHCILVYPRWGDSISSPWFSTVREVIDYMRYTLRGLSFLHKNNIYHRDIKTSNILVNHFAATYDVRDNDVRKTLRRDGQLVYAINDFDISIKFPPTATREECRLPISYSWVIGQSQPFDTRQGELDYDPFAFDVGCLGIIFSREFRQCNWMVPMFAPLMDRMITADISRRFTASEALEFLEGFASKMTEEELRYYVPPRSQRYVSYEDVNRWNGVREEFIKIWGHFREPKPSLQTRLLRRICDDEWGLAAVQLVRRIIRKVRSWNRLRLKYFPSTVYGALLVSDIQM